MNHTSGPWEASHHKRFPDFHTPKAWTFVKHNFPEHPYEGDLEEEYGIYPPLGQAGPVALVAGEGNARLIAVAPELLPVAGWFVSLVSTLDSLGLMEQIESHGGDPDGLRFMAEKARIVIAKVGGAEQP